MNRRECLNLAGVAAAASCGLLAPGARAAATPARIGVNCFDLFYGPLVEPSRVRAPRVRLREMADAGIPFVRFAASPFWPNEWALVQKQRNRYFDLMDEVFDEAARVGMGLVPSTIWGPAFLADFMGETVTAWGQADSRTSAYAASYVGELVSRYARSAQVLFWEFGNEFNLNLDARDASHWWPKTNPAMGTPARRSPDDSITTPQYQALIDRFCQAVKSAAPSAKVGTGSDRPRPNAKHLAEGSPSADSRADFQRAVQLANPRCAEVASLHLYPDKTSAYFGGTSNAKIILTEARAATRATGQTLFLGEFGVPDRGSASAQRATFAEFLDAIELAKVDLAALWVYDFHYQPEISVTPGSDRAWQLTEITRWNERVRRAAAR